MDWKEVGITALAIGTSALVVAVAGPAILAAVPVWAVTMGSFGATVLGGAAIGALSGIAYGFTESCFHGKSIEQTIIDVSEDAVEGAVVGGAVPALEYGASKAIGKVASKVGPKVKTAIDKVFKGKNVVDKTDDVANGAIDAAKGAAGEGGTTTKPNQVHHYATNKSKTYTPQLEEIANRYGLDLDDAWNKDLLPHQGRHPNAYHEYVLDSMKQFDNIAQGDKDIFLKLFDNLKNNVKSNPDMLYKDYWK